MGLSCAGAADQHEVALMIEEVSGGQIPDQGLVDLGRLEVELLDLLSQRQLGDGHLVLDRARLLLTDLGGQQIADDPLGFVLSLHRRGDDLVVVPSSCRKASADPWRPAPVIVPFAVLLRLS
jgi:hypothetical protein